MQDIMSIMLNKNMLLSELVSIDDINCRKWINNQILYKMFKQPFVKGIRSSIDMFFIILKFTMYIRINMKLAL